MNYRNSEMKIDQLVAYLNEEKINLSPAFQRGHVWKLSTRKKLVRNIVQGKPIPAVFLYKEAVGSKYSYNILDGKQRLESLILFIGDQRKDVVITNWGKYFFNPTVKGQINFPIELEEGRKKFASLGDETVRDFREYSIPTIEISLDDDSSLDQVISLFVDINQQGEPVKRFDIVKAMYKQDPLLKSVFGLLAIEQKRGQDVFYKAKNNEYTSVLKKLQGIESIGSPNSKVDKMWEKMLELALFARTRKHRRQVEILKEFIAPAKKSSLKLDKVERQLLSATFKFLKKNLPKLGSKRLFTDQTHSYTVVTSIMRDNLLERIGERALSIKLGKFSGILDKAPIGKLDERIGPQLKRYLELSSKQTTDASRRTERDKLFVEIVDLL